MAVRQEDVNSSMMNILKKMDAMVESAKTTNENSLLLLSSIDTVAKTEVSTELKKQTTILMSIEAKMKDAAKNEATDGDPKAFKELLGGLANGLEKIIKAVNKLDDKAGDKLKNFFTKLNDAMVDMDPDKTKAMGDLINGLGSNILKFGAYLTLYSIMAPLAMIGATLFGLTVRLLMTTAGTVDKDSAEGMAAVAGLGKGVLIFGLTMILYTIMAPIVMIGTVLFGLTMRLLFLSMGTFGDAKEAEAKAKVPLKIALGVILYALSMAVVSMMAPMILMGTLAVTLSMLGLSIALYVMGTDTVRHGVKSLLYTSLGIILFGLSIVLFSMMVTPQDSLYAIITIAGFAAVFYFIGQFWKDIAKGAIALLIVSFSLILLGVGLMIYKAANMTMDDALILGLTVGGLAVAMALAGSFGGVIIEGAIGMTIAAISLILISVGLVLFKAAKFTMDDALVLGATIGGLGIVMGLAGLASPFIIAGSAAMMVAGISLLLLSGGLAVFKAIGWKNEDGESLKNALGSVVSGFLGGDMPGGIIEGLKFAAAAAARAALLLITVGPMILAGLALISISAGLAIFKKIGFNQGDSDNLQYAIGGIVRAFSIITDKEAQKKMGINVNWFDFMLGVAALSGAGSVLASLAEGVQAWANLEVTEWEVINGGTAKAKLVIKNKRKLGKSDFENAANGMALVISAIAAPFAKVGMLNRGKSSGDPLYDAIFGGGLVAEGVDALKNSGDTLVNLAQGVKAWANLEITEYEVVNAGTKDAKIVPKSVRKMSTSDFVSASLNIGMVTGFLANELAKIGKMESDSSGIFSGGFVSKGVESIAGLGDNLLAMAEVIQKMANMELVENEVKMIDGKPQLVIKSVRKMNPTDFVTAAVNIGMITGFLAREIAKIGEMEDNSEGWFSDGYVKKGVQAIQGLGQNISSVADAVIKLANSEVTTYKVDSKGQLVPVSTRKMNSSDFKKAAFNLKTILSLLVHGIASTGRLVEANRSAVDSALDVLPDMTSALADAAKPVEAWGKLKDVDKTGQSINAFLSQVNNAFDPKLNPNMPKISYYFSAFATNLQTMADTTDQMTKLADNFDKIQKSMKLFKEHVNSFDLKKLTLTDSMMKSLAILAKNPEAIASQIDESIKSAFEELVAAIKELNGAGGGGAQTAGTQAAPATPTATGPAPKGNAPTNQVPAKGSQISVADLQRAFTQALTSVTIKTKSEGMFSS
jgi:hypothetical protein